MHRLLAAAATLGTVWGAASDLALGARYCTLRPAVAGCDVIVRETSWLTIGGGEAYTVGRTGIAWRTSGSWTVDDGYRPVAEGNYLLEWGHADGSLTVGGTATDPVLDGGVIGIDCS
ncbi:hypothetical protein [Streptomyces sp. MK7]|uniref:hypothetical protein n=1 Tax=Streptomyces sp. MK7 TaxID=3067635 RepID=UPI00292D01CC|nr:hypothetical protein [Streptomyces sp. MK7]